MRSRVVQLSRSLEKNAVSPLRAVGRRPGARWSSTTSSTGRQWSTPLAKSLGEAITATGPIPVASFMRQCLTSDLGGYYSSDTGDIDQFGRKGDFVTSPEISQIFGELIGLWIVAEWMAQGSKTEGVYLMEMGPGRGTLMDDMLRTIRNFKSFSSAIEAVCLVEASPSLRKAQHKLLCGDKPLEKTEIGYESISKYNDSLKIIWCEDIRLLPPERNKTPFIIAHEFFDALPIHVFQSVPPVQQPQQSNTIQTPTGPIEAPRTSRTAKVHQWRELLVSPTSPYATHASLGTPKSQQSSNSPPDFELSLAKASTPHSLYLPEQSPRYRALKSTTNAVIEVSPESQVYTADFAVRIGGSDPSQGPESARSQERATAASIAETEPSGAALILDYGPASTIPTNSLRGIKAHNRVSPFSEPGTVDISADVDFLGLAEAALNASPGVEVHGPVDQARFLNAMGIRERAAQLVKKAVDGERGGIAGATRREELTETVKRIESGWRRLVDTGPAGMGKLYQVMAIVPHVARKQGEAIRRPVGFGGDVSI